MGDVKMSLIKLITKIGIGAGACVIAVTALPIAGAVGVISATGAGVAAVVGGVAATIDHVSEEKKD